MRQFLRALRAFVFLVGNKGFLETLSASEASKRHEKRWPPLILRPKHVFALLTLGKQLAMAL